MFIITLITMFATIPQCSTRQCVEQVLTDAIQTVGACHKTFYIADQDVCEITCQIGSMAAQCYCGHGSCGCRMRDWGEQVQVDVAPDLCGSIPSA